MKHSKPGAFEDVIGSRCVRVCVCVCVCVCVRCFPMFHPFVPCTWIRWHDANTSLAAKTSAAGRDEGIVDLNP